MGEKILQKIERIDTFDLLRGYFLIVILFNHLAYYPSGLDLFTGRGLLYVSSAEGFFLISGIILGIVRGQKLINKPWIVGARLLLKRSVQLYITSIILALLFTFIGWQFIDNPGLKFGIASPDQNVLSLIWSTLTYQYLYGWADFLRQYAMFIAVAPLAIYLLRRGLWYVVLLLSAAIWSLFPTDTTTSLMLQPISWQLIFFSGLVIGFHWPQIQTWWRHFSPGQRRIAGKSLAVSFIATALIAFVLVFSTYFSGDISVALRQIDEFAGSWFNKDRLPIPRLLLGAVWFWGLFWLVRRYEDTIKKWLGWLLLPLGKNSLYVYTVEAFIVFFMHLFIMPPQIYTDETNWLVNLLLSLAALMLVWALVKKRVLFSIIPR